MSAAPAVIAQQRKREFGGIGGAVGERGGEPCVTVGRGQREQHREDSEQPEHHPEGEGARRGDVVGRRLHAREQQPERLHADPEHGGNRPARERPAGDDEERQRERDHDGPRKRPKQAVLRNRPRRSEDADAGQKAFR
jgi:hypothetical protein